MTFEWDPDKNFSTILIIYGCIVAAAFILKKLESIVVSFCTRLRRHIIR